MSFPILSVEPGPEIGQVRLAIRNDFAKAWIEYYPRLGDQLEHLGEIPDGRLWVKLPDRPASRQKSPTRLLIESQLRAWVLRRFQRRLRDLRFEQLRQIAQLLATKRLIVTDCGGSRG